MTKPLLLLSLPNSGSTWLAEAIAKHSPWSKYCMEFFNPMRNPTHYQLLRRRFGCELIDCYKNIAEPGDEFIDADIRLSWGKEDFNFTKEVFSPFKLPAFVEHFKVLVLLRSEEDSFPPKQARVWSFYEHAWYALECKARIRGRYLEGTDFESRSLEAHRLMTASLLTDAALHSVPIIHHHDLFDDERLPVILTEALGECSDQLVAAIKVARELEH